MQTFPAEMIDAAIAHTHLEILATYQLIELTRQNVKNEQMRQARIAQYEGRIADLETDHARLMDMELAAEAAEVSDVAVTDLPEVRGNRAMKRAMRDARANTTTLVRGAAGVGRSMERLAPGCCIVTGDMRTWEIVDEQTHDSYRLTLKGSATTGVLRYVKFSSIGF